MKTYTILIYYKDGRIEIAKNSVGSALIVKEHSIQDLNLLYTDKVLRKVLRLVAICNQDPHYNLVVIDSESKYE